MGVSIIGSLSLHVCALVSQPPNSGPRSPPRSFSLLTSSSSPPSSFLLRSSHRRWPLRTTPCPRCIIPLLPPSPRPEPYLLFPPDGFDFAAVKPFYLGEIGRRKPGKAGRIEMEVKGRSPWVYEKRLMGLMPNATLEEIGGKVSR